MSIRATEAIGQFESGGNYKAVGPTTKKGNKAYGKYQIMDFNIPTWSKEALGTSVSTEEFLNNPKIQDKIARHKIGQYWEKFKNVADVSSMWFSGKPAQAAGEAKDVLGTSVPQYIKNVESIYKRTTNPLFENFDVKVNKSRQLGLTDTDILNKLAQKDPEIKEKIEKSRTQLGLNDRDLLNKLSMKFSGKMPTVASIPLEGVQEKPVIEEERPGFFERVKRGVGESFQERLKDVEESAELTEPEKQSVASQALQFAGAGAGLLGDVIGSLFIEGIKEIPKPTEEVQEEFREAKKQFFESDMGKKTVEALQGGIESYNQFKKENPVITRNIESIANVGEILIGGKAGERALKELIEKGVDVGKVSAKLTKEATEKGVIISKKIEDVKKAKEIKKIEKIEELIKPKLTAKEQRAVAKEGRLIRGKEGFIFGKRPDTVIQSAKVKKSADTIQRRIPDASKLDDATLNNKLNTEIVTISKELSPQLKTISIDKERISDLKTSWEKLKLKQAKDPEFKAFGGSEQAQKNFEEFLNEASKSVRDPLGRFRLKSLDDIWDIRKRYDGSIKDGVKQADNLSSPSLQLQKEIWLDNRRILNDLLENMSQGLDKSSKKVFDDMADLYRARQNIIGSTKIDVKGTSGIFNIKNIFKAGAGAIGVKFLID